MIYEVELENNDIRRFDNVSQESFTLEFFMFDCDSETVRIPMANIILIRQLMNE